MSKILTFKNDRSFFTVKKADADSLSFSSLIQWAMRHCTLDDTSSNEVFILNNDDNHQTRLKGCRLFALKQKLEVSKITEL